MVANTMTPQGNLNRIRGSLTVASFQNLNVTAPYLDEAGISISFGDAATLRFKTMTGIVTSGEPYQDCVVTVNLLRSQALANSWEAQRQTNSKIGDIAVHPDTAPLSPYNLTTCTILNVGAMSFNGRAPGFVLTLGALLQINNNLWDFV